MTSAITSSEMHLDRVSICQNKAASMAASLMAIDVSDRRGRETVGAALQTLVLQACTRNNTNQPSLNLFYVRLFAHVWVFAPLIAYLCTHMRQCLGANAGCVRLNSVFFVVKHLPPSLTVMNWLLCQSFI